MKKILDYLLHMMEGSDNGLSIRRVIALVLLGFIGYLIIGEQITSQLTLNALYALLVSVLLLISVVTADNLISVLKKDK